MGAGRLTSSCRRGFTLVEVLATIALIGIALPVVMEGISVATRSADAARHRNEAAALAESKLNEIVATGQWQGSSSLSGNFNPDWPGYQWTATVSDWTQSGLEQVDVHVTWFARGGNQEIVVSSLVYNGANAGTGASSSGGSSGSTGTGSKTGTTSGGGTK